jgi:glutamyl/glutaminyl-tRNA synthetase
VSSLAREWLLFVVPPVAGSVDRLTQIPERLHTMFSFDAIDALARDEIRRECDEPGVRAVIAALAAELASSPRLLDREIFRAVAGQVRATTGLKGKALFHPIRVALTGALEGPELDFLVPAIERATLLSPADGVQSVTGCRERAAAFAAALA